MACCTARCTLVSICIFQLVFVLERTVFDALGYMYGLLVADGIQILMVLVGVIGTYCYKPKYLVPYGTMQFLWLGWNAYLVCYYFEVGFLQRKQMWSYPLTMSFDSQDYFDKTLLTCNKTVVLDVKESLGYTISEDAKESAISDWSMWPLLTSPDPNCLFRPLWFKLFQCALQMFFSFFAMLYVCYIVYGYEEDDDCFDFIGGFDNYNPGYPEGPASHTHPAAVNSSMVVPKHPTSMHQGYAPLSTGPGGSSGGYNPGNSMIMQPMPGMVNHPQMMDGRGGEMYGDSRA